jgi:hypothetical protein
VAEKLSIMAGVNDEALLKVTLRDKNWNPSSSGKEVQVEIRDSYGEVTATSYETDDFGQVFIKVSGLTEKHGNIMVKVSYDMGFENTANFVHLKVIGG